MSEFTVISREETKALIREVVAELLQPIIDDITSIKGDTWYTVREVAKRLKKDKTTVYRYCVNGEIQATPHGRTFSISHTSLENYLTGKNED